MIPRFELAATRSDVLGTSLILFLDSHSSKIGAGRTRLFIGYSLFRDFVCRAFNAPCFNVLLAAWCANWFATRFSVQGLSKRLSNSKFKKLPLEQPINSKPFRVSEKGAPSVRLEFNAPGVLFGSEMVSAVSYTHLTLPTICSV